MWNTESSGKAVLAEGRYVEAENGHCGRQKLSSGMAMVLGALLTMEIMLGGQCCLILISVEQISLPLYCHSWYYILQWWHH